MASLHYTSSHGKPVKTCAYCGKEYAVKPPAFDKSKYCSRDCMANGYKTQMAGSNNPHYSNAGIKTCERCGNQYKTYKTQSKYCSVACARNTPDAPRTKICAHCGNEFSVKPSHYHKRKYCSSACSAASQSIGFSCETCGKQIPKGYKYCSDCTPYGKNVNAVRTCAVCGNHYQSQSRLVTCSDRCHRLYRTIMQKGEKSHRWQGGKTPRAQAARKLPGYRLWRESVFQRDDYTCQLCKQRGGNLTSHHIKLFSTHPELATDVNNGITLCRSCHASIRHKEQQYEQQFTDYVHRL